MNAAALTESLVRLISRTATDLPGDVEAAIRKGFDAEAPGSPAQWALGEILANAALARERETPICQDSGTMTFVFEAPPGTRQTLLMECARNAVIEATRRGRLRQNTVDAVTGASSPTNEGAGVPVVHVREGAPPFLTVRLVMKGGGCENVARQYALPDEAIRADRDMEGAFRCVMDTLVQAQGKGCSPGIVGICIGGDRAGGFASAKEQFFRRIDEASPDPVLAGLERRVMDAASQLGIGPMGLGGRTTLLGAKACALSRLPASFFVSVSYMCWALRRFGIELDAEQRIARWIES